MNTFKLKTSRQLLCLAMSFAVSASAFAAVTSDPTSTVMGRAPVMAPPSITYVDTNGNGVKDAGDTLTAVDGTITDADLDTAIASTYRWSDGAADVSITSTHTISVADYGKTLTLFAIPHTDTAITDPADGLEVAGTIGSGGEIVVVPSTQLLSVAVTGYVGGNPQVDSELTATPTCVTADCGTVTYQWEIESAPGSGTYASIAGATSSTYTPVRDDQRRMIRVVADQ
jgi:hypothetical protein